MGIKSKINPDHNLFNAIDKTSKSSTATFVFRIELTEEAMTIVPGLPLLLQAKYGQRIWNWFTAEATQQVQGYKWTEEGGIVEDRNLEMETLLPGWKDLGESKKRNNDLIKLTNIPMIMKPPIEQQPI